MSHYLSKNNPLKDPRAWISSKYANLDIPLDEYLRSQGASTEALRLTNFNIASLTNNLETTSALWALRNNQRSQNPSKKIMRIKGGNSRLPEKMAASLKSPVKLNKIVNSIHSKEAEVEIKCTDDSKFKADYAVVTLPFSVLRKVEISPPLKGAQAEAVEKLQYTAVTEIHLTIRRPFWEKDSYPLMMWTDSLLQTILPIKDATGKVESLVCWVNGDDAKKLDEMTTNELSKFVYSELKRIRPATTDNIDIARVISWGKDPYTYGAYSPFRPGQIQAFQSKMAQPWRRIHFAGEHTAITSAGMESALESAERVVSEILTVQTL